MIDKVIKRVLYDKTYLPLFQYSVNHIWESGVKDEGWWSKKDTADFLLEEIFFQIIKRRENFIIENSPGPYEYILLSNQPQADYELKTIISNARSRTMELYMKETGRIRKSHREIQRDFEKMYGHLSVVEKNSIKKGRRSGVNRYKSRNYNMLELKNNSVSDNSVGRFQTMRMLEQLDEGLTQKEKQFLFQLIQFNEEEIARIKGIKTESVKRDKRRLKIRIKCLFK